MLEEYDQITAFHYSAYRPPLHAVILQECLDKVEQVTVGLDVGCGTGHSSLALANYCNKVIGIDPNKKMLEKSILNPKIDYRHYNKKYFDFPDDHFDVATFAGSLFYAKSQVLLDEVIRVAKSGSKIIIYDFDLPLDHILDKLNLESTSKEVLHYDHQVNFDNLNQEKIVLKKKSKNIASIEVSLSNLSHLLLSAKDNYSILSASLGEEALNDKVSQRLHSAFKTKKVSVDAITYSIVYQNVK